MNASFAEACLTALAFDRLIHKSLANQAHEVGVDVTRTSQESGLLEVDEVFLRYVQFLVFNHGFVAFDEDKLALNCLPRLHMKLS